MKIPHILVIAMTAFAWSASVQASVGVSNPDLTYVQTGLSGAATLSTYSFAPPYGTFAGTSIDLASFQAHDGGAAQPSASSSSPPGAGFTSSSATASANLGSGILRAYAQESGITGSSAASGAALWDTLTFSGASGVSPVGQIVLTVPGTFTDVGYGGACLAIGASCNPFSVAQLNSAHPSTTVTVPFSIVNGSPTLFYSALYATASNSFSPAIADLSDPPHISLILPTGVTFTSTSGVFLTSPVPLPPAMWLFSSGLIGLLRTARRKKQG